jgi:hypothetical protein
LIVICPVSIAADTFSFIDPGHGRRGRDKRAPAAGDTTPYRWIVTMRQRRAAIAL